LATKEQLTARVAEIDRLLSKGVSATSVNGISISRDLDALRDERRRIEEQLDRSRRPRCASVNLSRF
jgi:hypothetical protein